MIGLGRGTYFEDDPPLPKTRMTLKCYRLMAETVYRSIRSVHEAWPREFDELPEKEQRRLMKFVRALDKYRTR